MKEPQVYLACAPKGLGLICGLMLIAGDSDVYGWYTGAANGKFPMSFFMLEDFYSLHGTVFYRSLQNDVYGDWALVQSEAEVKIDKPIPLPEDMCHELERIQDMFVREWLFCANDPESTPHIHWYREHGLLMQQVNLRQDTLNKLDQSDTVWTYKKPLLDMNIISFLEQHWALDYSL